MTGLLSNLQIRETDANTAGMQAFEHDQLDAMEPLEDSAVLSPASASRDFSIPAR